MSLRGKAIREAELMMENCMSGGEVDTEGSKKGRAKSSSKSLTIGSLPWCKTHDLSSINTVYYRVPSTCGRDAATCKREIARARGGGKIGVV